MVTFESQEEHFAILHPQTSTGGAPEVPPRRPTLNHQFLKLAEAAHTNEDLPQCYMCRLHRTNRVGKNVSCNHILSQSRREYLPFLKKRGELLNDSWKNARKF